MATWLYYGVFVALAGVVIVLAIGVFNLARTDARARSRSNQLMRLRVLMQFIAIVLLVALGAAAGAFR